MQFQKYLSKIHTKNTFPKYILIYTLNISTLIIHIIYYIRVLILTFLDKGFCQLSLLKSVDYEISRTKITTPSMVEVFPEEQEVTLKRDSINTT